MIRILGESSPAIAAVLDHFSREAKRKSEGNEKHAQRGGAQDIETAIIQALAPLQNTLNFEGLISKTNDYDQTLAHFAVLFGYIKLLRQLVEWNIDLTIADVNGLTALHCAYKKGDRACVELLIEHGASETVLDALGRAPPHLMPEGFDSSDDYDTDMASDGQTGCGEVFNDISLSQNNGLGDETSDSDDEKSMGGPERACQEWLDQMDNHRPVASTSKAVASGSMGRARYKRSHRIRKTRRIPDVPVNPDVNSVLQELRERWVDVEAIEYLRTVVFPTGEISLSALRAPLSHAEVAQADGATIRYHGLLKIENGGYRCRLCPRDNELLFDDDEEALQHITVSHLEMRYGCVCGWYVELGLHIAPDIYSHL